MAEETQGPSGVKDLGGLINKDIAFSKVPENVVYESTNFRVTTDDGGTLAVRSNIKGNTSVVSIPNVPCIYTITLDNTLFPTTFQINEDYIATFNINGASALLTFTYSSYNNFFTDFLNFLQTNVEFVNRGIIASGLIFNGKITLQAFNCESITFLGFTTAAGLGVAFPYQVKDQGFELNNNLQQNFIYNDYYNYLLSNSYPTLGSLADDYWNFDYVDNPVPPTLNKWETSFVTGIYDSNTHTWYDHGTKSLRYRALSVNDTYHRTIVFNTSAVNSPSLPTTSYPGGTLNFSCQYYVGALNSTGTAITNKKFKIYAVIDGWVGATSLISTDPTIAGVSYLPMVKLYEGTLTQSTSGAANFTFNLPANNKIQRYYLVVDVERASGAGTLNIEFYLNTFTVTGPFLNPNILTIGLTSPGISNPRLIGWTTLRNKNEDNLYLLTTNGTFNPDDPNTAPFSSYGQWWKFTYPKEGDYSDSNIYSINLIYNNLLNLTTYRPVANPGMIESRYENEFIQKIYWTDNYNVPRVINVADPNVASLSVEDLNLQPSLSMDMPLITEVIDSGGLYMGVYQVAYRLKNINGSETRFSRTSQLIPIIDAREKDATVTKYYPYSPVLVTNTATTNSPITYTNSTKAIRVNVSNIDIDYDTIEFALIYYSNDVDVPTIDIVYETRIPDNGEVEVIITGGETKVPITVDELTAFTTSILTAKTLAAKKQTLFLGNVTLGTQVVEWDSRAYRFPINSNDTYIKDSLNNSYKLHYDSNVDSYTITEWNDPVGNVTTYPVPLDVAVDADCIQNYSSQGPTTDTNYLYKPNSNILGGAGPNVSYEFVTETVLLDIKNDQGTYVFGPHLVTDSYYTIVLDQDPYYKSKGISLSNNASPYVYDMFVGYKRDEMERFGIVFFDELDNPTYVNWIADIRMPHIYMPDSTANVNPAITPSGGRARIGVDSLTFSSDIISYNTTNKRLYGKPLGIKFTIDFSGIPSKYKKASIVRVPKKEEDKHIVGQGLMMPTFKYYNSGGGVIDPENLNALFTTPPNTGNPDLTVSNQNWYDTWTFHSPEFLFGGNPTFSGNDEVDFISFLNDISNTVAEQKTAQLFFPCSGTPNGFSIGDIYYQAVRSKNYIPIETNILPAFIKRADTNNSYPLTNTYPIIAGGADRKYLRGNVPATGGGIAARTIHNCSPKDLTVTNGGGTGTGALAGNTGYSYGNNTLLLQLQWDKALNWDHTTGGPGDAYLVYDGWSNKYGGPVYLANYKRTPASQYGGNTFFARANSEYIPCNNLLDISNKTNPITTKVFGGDTIVTVMDHVYQFFDRAEGVAFGNDTVNLMFTGKYFPVETSIAVDYRENFNNLGDGVLSSTNLVYNRTDIMGIPGGPGDALWETSPRIGSAEHFKVDPVYNHTNKGVYRYFPAPALGKISGSYDCRVWKSEPKQDGEVVESWSNFKPGAYLDVESAYGSLNNLIVFRDKLYYFQDRAFGQLQVNEQKLIQPADTTAANLVLGSSGILERYDYISTKTGTKHQFGMSVSDYSMIWFDTLARKMYRYKGEGLEPLSDIKGLNAFLYNRLSGNIQVKDNPYIYEGIHCTYDFRHNEFYMTFLDRTSEFYLTLVYNDLLDGYIGEYTHYPKVYLNDKLNIFSPNPNTPNNETLFIHNYGRYGNFYQSRVPDYSTLSFVLNTSATTEKVLQNLEFVTEAYSPNTQQAPGDSHYYDPLAQIDYTDFFESMRIFDNYQNTDWITLIPNRTDLSSRDNYARRHKTIWNVRVPSDRVLDVNQNIFDNLNLSAVRPRLTRRLKDKWFMVELTYNNTPNNKLVVHSAKPSYAVNSR